MTKITAEDPYKTPMRIYPAIHYTMGGLWVDYDLESTIPGLFVLGEANFSDHGANRLGASALMQGLADGYFIIPYTMGQHLATRKLPKVSTDHPAFAQALADAKGRVERIASINGQRTVDSIHRDLGRAMWERCGMSRDEAGLKATIERVRQLRDEFWRDVKVPGTRRIVQSEPRTRRPRGRLSRVRGTLGGRRAASQRIVRRPFPRGVSDARWRGPARRCELLLRRCLGVSGGRQAGRPP